MPFPHPLSFLTPELPSSTIAMTTSSASATLPTVHNDGLLVTLHNQAAGVCYVAFGATATTAGGYAIEAGQEAGPFRVPEQETQISAILAASTGNLRITYFTLR